VSQPPPPLSLLGVDARGPLFIFSLKFFIGVWSEFDFIGTKFRISKISRQIKKKSKENLENQIIFCFFRNGAACP
jgi:hypothetical protein